MITQKFKAIALAITCLFVGHFAVNAQCPNTNTFYADITPTFDPQNASWASIGGVWRGDYLTATVCAGATYTFTMCDNGTIFYDARMTLYNNTGGAALGFNDDYCGTLPQITWEATFTGVIRILIDGPACSHFLGGAGMTVACYMNSNCGTTAVPAGQVTCNADVGTFTYTLNGSPFNPATDPAVLCGGDATSCLSVTSNSDWIQAPSCDNNPFEVSEIMYAIYTTVPPATPDPAVDAGYSGFLWSGQDYNQCGNTTLAGILGTSNYWFVPITADDGDNGGDPNGVINFDQDGDGCYVTGTPIEVIEANPVTMGAPDVNCYNGVVTINVQGGLPEFDGSNYVITNNGSGTIISGGITHNGYIVISGLTNGQTYNIDVTDASGSCTDNVTAVYTACPCPTVDFTYTSPVQCDDPGQWLFADEGAMAPGESITPCYYVQVLPSNAQAGNTIEYFENAASLGTLNVTANTNYQGFLSYVDAAATNTFELCETTAGANMTYMVFDCHSGALITSGTWIADGTGCQTVTVTPPSTNIAGTTTWTGTGITATTNWGAAFFDPSVAGAGTHSINYAWDNGNGCSSNISHNIVVQDLVNPTITCPGNQTGNVDASCNFSLPDYTGLATAADNCSGLTVTQSPAIGTNVGVGTTTITLTATDGGSNTATCTFDVVVSDLINPTITCPGNQTGNVDASCNFTLLDYTALATAADNCGVVVTQSPVSGTNVGVGTTTITLTATDPSSNTATCTFDVVVTDIIPPTITCPGNQTGNVDASCNFSLPDYTGLATAGDNCPGVTVTQSPVTGTNVGVGTTTITLTATDAAGLTATCTFDVVVTDATAPTITCPGNQTGNVDATCNFALLDYTGLATAGDNCPGVTVTQSPVSGTNVGVGTTTITLTATDGAGLTATCTFDVVVTDNINPTITCPANQTGNVDATCNFSLPDYTGMATANDNCPGVVVTQSPAIGSNVGVGTTTITLTATDASSNTATCTFDVVVTDATAPTITCPGNQTGNVDAACNFALPDYTGLATANDNCPGVVVTQSPAIGSNVGVGTTTITLTATDAAGLTATCTFDVVVTDVTVPTITCPGNQNETFDAACSFTLPDYTGLATANDNCGIASVTQSPIPGSVIVGTTTITLTATDVNGLTNTCTFDVVATDVTPPTITCPGNQTGNVDATCNFTLPDYTGLATANDNCSVTVTQSPAIGTNVGVGTTTITLTATDGASLTATCTFDVVVTDVTPPTITCPGNQTGTVDATCNFALPDYTGLATANDNCGVTVTQSPAIGTNVGVGTTTITLTATDPAGLTTTCNFDVVVTDITAPSITCPGNQTETFDATCSFTLPDYTGLATATDNCGIASVTQSPIVGTVISGTTTITLTATDVNGLTSTCTFDVIPNDNTNPTALCQNISVNLDGTGNVTIVAADIDGGSTDNCGAVTLSASQTAFGCADIGPNNVTLTVTDGSSNTATCVAVVTVVDPNVPTVTAGPDDAICEGSTYTLAGVLGGSATSGTWSTSGDGGFSANTDPNAVYTPGPTDISNGTVTLTFLTDASPCATATDDMILTIEETPTFTVTLGNHPTLCGATDGTIVISGLNPSTNYDITYNDGTGTINLGTVTTDGAGDYIITGLGADGYSNFVVTLGNCTTTVNVPIALSDPSAPVFTAAFQQDPTTCGGTDGEIILTGLNASTAYDITYDNGFGTVNLGSVTTDASGNYVITGLAADSFTNFVVTLSGCTGSSSVIIVLTDPAGPTFTVGSPVDPTSCGGTDGTITISGLNPSTNYDITYDDGTGTVNLGTVTTDASGNYVITGLDADNYTNFNVTDGINCNTVDASVITLNDPNAPTFTAAFVSDPTTCGGADGVIEICGLNASTLYDNLDYDNGVGTVNFGSFTTDATGCFQITGLSQDTYDNFNVTLASCVGTVINPITLTDPNAPTFTAAFVSDPTTCGGADGVIEICGLNASTLYDNLDYDNGVGTINFGSFTTDATGCFQITGLSQDTYDNFNVTLAGCTGTLINPITLTDPNAPTFTAAFVSDPTTCGGADGVIEICGLNASTLYDNLDYDNGSGTVNFGSFTTDATGCFQITGLDQDTYDNFNVTLLACTGTVINPITLTDPNAPTFTASMVSDPTTCGGADGVIEICGLNASTLYDNLDYDNGAGTINFGSFTTDATGCFQITGLSADAYTNFVVTLTGCSGNRCNYSDSR